MSDSLYILVYLSRSVVNLSKTELVDLCAAAATKNGRIEVTGLLLCVGNKFLQILEVPQEAVTNLYDKIERDERHTQCRTLFEGDAENRLFGQWSMNFLQMDEDFFLKIEEFDELRKLAVSLLEDL